MNPLDNIRGMIEYTNLKSPSSKEIRAFVEVANREKFFGVCMQYGDLGVAAKYRDPNLKLITVAGFPPFHLWPMFKNPKPNPNLLFTLGNYSAKDIDTIRKMMDDPNVDEIDLVFPMLWYARGHLGRIYRLFKGVKQNCNKPVKVITELGTVFRNLISLFEIADLIEQSGIDYFKTNTGLIAPDVNMTAAGIIEVKNLKPTMKFKASGGIRTIEQINYLKTLGVTRIGTSSIPVPEASLKEKKNDAKGY